MTTSSWNREKWSRVWAEHKWAIFNIIVLAWAWSLGEGAFFIQVSTTSLAATAFQYQSISTIPIGCMLLIATIVSLILPPAIKRVGHRIPLTIGALLGAVGACVCIAATWNRSYGWLVVGATLIGFQVPCTLYYRLLALQFSPPEFAPYAIALVVAGGCISSILGPEFAKQTVNAFTKQYAGSYLTTVAECATLAILMSIVMQWNKGGKKHTSTLESETITSTAADVAINIDKEKSTSEHEAIEREEVSAIRFHDQSYAEDTLTSSETTTAIPITISDPIKTTSEETRVSNASDAAPVAAHDHPIVRSIWQIATDNNYDFIVAVLGGAVSWSGMALLMSATPLSMKGHKYVYDQSTSAIEVHLVGMFLPSIFSGLLIKKFGPRIILSLGLAIIIIGGATFNTGYALANYYGPITVVGVGWNFGYVGGSSLMATTYRNELEKVKAHSVYETIVMIGITISFFTSGFALTGLGWNWFTGLVVIYVGVIWLFVCLHSLYVYVNRTEPTTATAAPTKTLHTSSSTSEQQIPVQV